MRHESAMPYLWLLAVSGALLASSGCSEPDGPDLSGPSFFTATLDGASWVPDSATATVFASATDTTIIVGAARRVSMQEVQGVVIVLHGFGAPGRFPLADSTSRAGAFLNIVNPSGPFPPPTVTYWSRAAHPGSLSITGVSRSDSVVAGTFSFEGATDPDSTSHHRLTGEFRVRYRTEQAYCVACSIIGGVK